MQYGEQTITMITQHPTDKERLANVEANQETIAGETTEIKQDLRQLRTEVRYYFLAALIVIIAMWISIIIALA